jgi:hypothetical protein
MGITDRYEGNNCTDKGDKWYMLKHIGKLIKSEFRKSFSISITNKNLNLILLQNIFLI